MGVNRQDWPEGTKIKLVEDDGSVTESVTKSFPWQLGDGSWVVKVEGKTGGYDLGRCEVIITGPIPADLDGPKMEAACDRFIALGNEMGLSRREMASVASAIAANHMIATGVTEERAMLCMEEMYGWRAGFPPNVKVLVKP